MLGLFDASEFGQPEEQALEDFQADAEARLRELWQTLHERDQMVLLEAACVPKPAAKGLKLRGLLDEEGRPFGRVLAQWLESGVQ